MNPYLEKRLTYDFVNFTNDREFPCNHMLGLIQSFSYLYTVNREAVFQIFMVGSMTVLTSKPVRPVSQSILMQCLHRLPGRG